MTDGEQTNKEHPTSFTNAESIFSALASDKRLGIINELYHTETARPVDIARRLKIGQQLLHEHFTKLESAGLAEKVGEAGLSLTTFGDTIAGLIDTYLFLSEHREYFSDHNFGEMPAKFARRIGSLHECHLVKGLANVLDVWERVQTEARDYVYMAVPDIPLVMLERLTKSLDGEGNRRIAVRCLFPAARSERMDQDLKKIRYKELVKANVVKERKFGKIQVAVVLNEKQSFVFFPNLRGETDMLSAFYGEVAPKLEGFHEWCLDYFRYRWHENDPVLLDSSKI